MKGKVFKFLEARFPERQRAAIESPICEFVILSSMRSVSLRDFIQVKGSMLLPILMVFCNPLVVCKLLLNHGSAVVTYTYNALHPRLCNSILRRIRVFLILITVMIEKTGAV